MSISCFCCCLIWCAKWLYSLISAEWFHTIRSSCVWMSHKWGTLGLMRLNDKIPHVYQCLCAFFRDHQACLENGAQKERSVVRWVYANSMQCKLHSCCKGNGWFQGRISTDPRVNSGSSLCCRRGLSSVTLDLYLMLWITKNPCVCCRNGRPTTGVWQKYLEFNHLPPE